MFPLLSKGVTKAGIMPEGTNRFAIRISQRSRRHAYFILNLRLREMFSTYKSFNHNLKQYLSTILLSSQYGANLMSEVCFESLNSKSERHQYSLPSSSKIVDFSNEDLVLIDLSPIVHLNNLHTLKLNNNKIVKINLNPIRYCGNLEVLELQQNKLRELDFEPLHNCVFLKKIDVSKNLIDYFDFKPLKKCKNLEWLNFSYNGVQSIDLVPLLACCNLRHLEFRGNPISCSTIYPNSINESTDRIECSGSHFATIFSETWDSLSVNKRIAYQSQFLGGLGVGILSGFKFNLPDILSSIPAGLSSDSFVKRLLDKIIMEIDSKLNDNASTVFANVDRISKSPAAAFIPKILANRKKELSNIILPIYDEIVQLENLWFTAYGFQVLSSSDYRLQCRYSDFLEIKSSIESIGVELQVQRDNEKVTDIEISEELRETIITYAKLDSLARKIIWYIRMNHCQDGVSIHKINTHLGYSGYSRKEILEKISQLLDLEYVVSLELGKLILGSTATSIWPI